MGNAPLCNYIWVILFEASSTIAFAEYAGDNISCTHSSNMEAKQSSISNRKTLSMVFCELSCGKCGRISSTSLF